MPILFDEIRHFYSNTEVRPTQPRLPGPRHSLLYGSLHSYAAIPVEHVLVVETAERLQPRSRSSTTVDRHYAVIPGLCRVLAPDRDFRLHGTP